ncbi:MAG: LytTR family DNA-binding domain-containing protein [Lachnospiraceae bacterium]|nr:LytTR family DNA-binding domain-containing protein [Lachnospiraceae bacterium]
MIRIAIVEDEEIWADTLKRYSVQFAREQLLDIRTEWFTDGAAIADVYTGNFDIILMDIEMPLMNGMDAAREIRKKDEQVVIIFITNMAQFAIQGYRVGALDYILKPISYLPFSESLMRAIRQCRNHSEEFLSISTKGGLTKLRIGEIQWVESQGHRLTFHTDKSACETTTMSMRDLEEQLGTYGFSRCNSGILVNLRAVTGYSTGTIQIGNDSLPVSRGRRAEFMQKLVSVMTE